MLLNTRLCEHNLLLSKVRVRVRVRVRDRGEGKLALTFAVCLALTLALTLAITLTLTVPRFISWMAFNFMCQIPRSNSIICSYLTKPSTPTYG